MGNTTIVDRLNKLSGKDATTIAKALENLEEGGGIGGFEIHICTSAEYDSSTLVPTVTNPDASTLYLVPTSSKSKNMFDEYVWTGTDWEKFGTGSVALPSPTTSDNGKVLGVDGGEYKLVEQSGGAEIVSLGKYYGNAVTGSNAFSGGGAYNGNLSEVIGNKTVINSFAVVKTSDDPPIWFRGRFNILNEGENIDPVVGQETLKTITTTVGINFDIQYLGTAPASGSQAELFLVLV